MSSVDWNAIRDEYEDGLSLRQLAAKYGVSKSVIGQRKYEEKWKEKEKTPRTPPPTQEVQHPDMNAAVRASLGFRLRFKEGKTWEEVATGAGYKSRGTAYDAVMREARRHIAENVEETRQVEQYRIEQLQQRAFDEGIDQNNTYWTFAVDRYVALSKRKSELLNLDIKPEEVLASQPYTKRIILTHESQPGGEQNASSNG